MGILFQKKGLSFTLDWTAQVLKALPSIIKGGGGGGGTPPARRGGGGGGLLPAATLVVPISSAARL